MKFISHYLTFLAIVCSRTTSPPSEVNLHSRLKLTVNHPFTKNKSKIRTYITFRIKFTDNYELINYEQLKCSAGN